MLNPELLDHAYGLILCDSMPYVIAPPGSAEPAVTVRGVVRLGEQHARIAVTTDPDVAAGVAVTVDLHELATRVLQGSTVGVADLIDTAAALLQSRQTSPGGATDSHGNGIWPLPAPDRVNVSPVATARLEIFSLLNQFTGGVGVPRFTDVYRLTGFMFQPDRKCRLYIHSRDPHIRYGLQIPLVKADGHAVYGVGASLMQELFAKTREGQLAHETHLPIADDYCDEVLDLTAWVDPPVPQIVPPAPPGTHFP